MSRLFKLFNQKSGDFLGAVSAADIKVLIDQLEEEDTKDADYFIDSDTLDILELSGASTDLVAMLRAAIGDGEGVDVRWEK